MRIRGAGRTLDCSLTDRFIYLFIYSFIHLFIYLLIYLLQTGPKKLNMPLEHFQVGFSYDLILRLKARITSSV